MGGKSANKAGYFDKLKGLLEEYKSIFIVTVDNVSSQQMHEIRQSLRGQGVVLMGKNTMVRRALKTFIPDSPEYERLLPFVKGNVGFVFTNGDLKDIRDKILANKVAAPARAGAVAPSDVWIPAGNTGMEPGKTSFFQALGVPTKIARGTIEIVSDLKLVEANSKVGPSEATLLNMLNISPFTYGMGIAQVYDQGNTFPASVLDIGEEQLLKAFAGAITTIAAVSLAINFPTLPSVIHSFFNGYKNVLAVAIETEISWPEIEELKDRIANPDAYAAAAPAAAAGGAAEAKEEAKEEEEKEEESDEDGGFGGLLYVSLTPSCFSCTLTLCPATKYDGKSVTTWLLSGLRIGLRRCVDLGRLYRWVAGQSSTSHLTAKTRHFGSRIL
ncbi:ribosomal protein L10 [Colletotrichum graminicola]|nr:ribosomal protein L10 [Colletotrichum graminicola]